MQVDGSNDQQQRGDEKWGESVEGTSDVQAEPGDIVVGAREPIVGSDVSTPLEEHESDGPVPPGPLWAMKERRHIQWHLLPKGDRHEQLRDCVGFGDDAIYVIDDGRSHAMVSRRVGAVSAECEYCLIGRVHRDVADELHSGALPTGGAFDSAMELALCGVAIEENILSSNVFDVSRYESIADVPSEYRPGAPFLELTEVLEVTS
jgi:hypothetical protein